jgi:hypothetical protein
MVSLRSQSIELLYSLHQRHERRTTFQRKGFQLSEYDVFGCVRGVPDARDGTIDYCAAEIRLCYCESGVECLDVDHV